MKKTFLILIFTLTTFVCFGQIEHLEPARDFKHYEGDSKEYYDNKFSKLYKEFSQTPYARYTSMPSFTSEYAFSVEATDGKYYIISNGLSENFWYARERNKVKVITNKTEIDHTLYSKIGELFQIFVEQTKKIETDSVSYSFVTSDNDTIEGVKRVIKLDGEVYYFTITDTNGEIKTGQTWSPNKDSMLYRLVNVCDKLFSLDSKSNSTMTDILNEIDTLIEDYRYLIDHVKDDR
ncbi:MAG: hypothetical protein PHR13_08025 [Dysgonamonadaceae bacterium]|nr:hypothetical protein [Dysgonamonadaceae bacterium]MDD3901104.1 hypothetical protein [Dysgonamonadaceae bacterium]MDD4399356.1 hypothetical protein [Dysgonamonadaceae bacterium]